MPTGLPNVSTNDALAARNFAIEVDGTTIAQFTEVGGLTSEMDVTELKENGPDGKLIIKKIPGAHKTPTLTLKRAKNVSMELYKWHKLALDGKIKEARKNGSVILYDYEAGEVARWNFINAWPSKLTTGSLKAGSNDVVTEEATIVMEGFERVK
jgi:phage tail-like protein